MNTTPKIGQEVYFCYASDAIYSGKVVHIRKDDANPEGFVTVKYRNYDGKKETISMGIRSLGETYDEASKIAFGY